MISRRHHMELYLMKKNSIKQRPTVSLSNGIFSIPCLLFKASEDLSDWSEKNGIYAYARLEQNDEHGFDKEATPYLKIVYIGCTLDFSNIKYTSGTAITRHKPTHICFYQNRDGSDMKEVAESLIDFYKPLAMVEFDETLASTGEA